MASPPQAISPNLLKHFDPYHILKPEKINPGPRVDKLIDIDDFTVNTEAIGSLNDQKPKYDLIDLVQNLYVTPNHVKRDAIEIDCEDFFNNPASNDNIDGVKKDNSVQNERPEVFIKDNVSENKTPKVLVPIDLDDLEHLIGIEKRVTLNKSNDNIDSDSEDLIDQVLSEKNMEKIILKEVKDCGLNKLLKFNDFKVLNAPDIDLQMLDTQGVKKTSKYTQTNLLIPEGSNSKLNNQISNDLKTIKNKTIDFKEREQINNTNFVVIPHKRNPKLFKKKCEIKTEIETKNYTKGADFKEISAVLPDIMSRLSARRVYLEQKEVSGKKYRTEENRIKEDTIDLKTMRLDHDKLVNIMQKEIECNPIILMADCNKARLKAFKQGKEFQKFVMGEKHSA